MEPFFATIQTTLKNPSPTAFVNYLRERQIKTFKGFLLFHGQEIFDYNLDYLDSPITLATAVIELLTAEQDFRIIGQTIDGDFLAATLEETWVIPKNLIETDIERYPLTILEFLIAFEAEEIHSKILGSA